MKILFYIRRIFKFLFRVIFGILRVSWKIAFFSFLFFAVILGRTKFDWIIRDLRNYKTISI